MPLQCDDLFEFAVLWSVDPAEVLRCLGASAGVDLVREFDVIEREVERRADAASLQYPQKFKLGSNSLALLYQIVRSMRPEVIVETGVADGWSSAVILAAMDVNGCGALHSIDIDSCCGLLVEPDHPRWHKHVTDGSADQLSEVLSQLPELDLFLHDSDHSYRAQTAEYHLALQALRQGGLLVSDDVNWSNAFLDVCREHRLSPLVLADPTKLTGLVRLDASFDATPGGISG